MDIEYFFYVDDSTLQHLRPATSDERKWYHSLAQELGPYQKNIDRFQRVEDRFSALAEILEAPEKNAAKLERNAKDAVANFLYSFNECLDHWRTSQSLWRGIQLFFRLSKADHACLRYLR